MFKEMRISFPVIGTLLRKDLLAFMRAYLSHYIDTVFLLFTIITVFGYFMPELNMGTSFGLFLFIGSIAGLGLFQVTERVGTMVADIEGDRTISYLITMPMPSSTAIAYHAVVWSIYSAITGLTIIPIGKILLWNQFDLSNFHYGKFLLIFVVVNLFFGFFALFITSIIKGLQNLSTLYLRVLNPMYMFGAFFYKWYDLEKISPVLAKLTLIIPMTYIMEGTRAAAFGQKDYLNYWTCLGVLVGLTVVLGSIGIRILKKRLDCV
ncbi:MAG: hypothetical protein S4CHLAM37_15160 [Chlamydiia bacterium]|nr:hypothetical protein [Chlamydiia bacterium]